MHLFFEVGHLWDAAVGHFVRRLSRVARSPFELGHATVSKFCPVAFATVEDHLLIRPVASDGHNLISSAALVNEIGGAGLA